MSQAKCACLWNLMPCKRLINVFIKSAKSFSTISTCLKYTNALCGILSPINMHYKQRVRNAAGGRPHKKKNLLPLSRIITLHTHTFRNSRTSLCCWRAKIFPSRHNSWRNECLRALTSQQQRRGFESAVCWLYIWSAINYGALK